MKITSEHDNVLQVFRTGKDINNTETSTNFSDRTK